MLSFIRNNLRYATGTGIAENIAVFELQEVLLSDLERTLSDALFLLIMQFLDVKGVRPRRRSTLRRCGSQMRDLAVGFLIG